MSSHIDRIDGRAIAVRGQDLDTDRIIPARFLKAVTFDGLQLHVFEDDRRALKESGQTHPFDDPAHRGAAILFANGNFGCGSSREHAPQALRRWGIRAVVAESFGEIFFGNSMMIGLPCLTASHEDVERLMRRTDTEPDTTFVVDIRHQTISGGGFEMPLQIPPSAREALLSGDWDATGLLLERYEEVDAVATRLPYPGFIGH